MENKKNEEQIYDMNVNLYYSKDRSQYLLRIEKTISFTDKETCKNFLKDGINGNIFKIKLKINKCFSTAQKIIESNLMDEKEVAELLNINIK